MKEIKLCPHFKCRFHLENNPMDDRNNFCPQCGREAIVKKVKIKGQVEDAVDSYDVLMEMKERLYEYCSAYPIEGSHIWVSNSAKSPGIRLERGDGVGEIKRYTWEIIQQETAAFTKRHAKDLKILHKHYGEDRVTICWGLLASIG
jgi:hypothetical protein